MGFISNIPLSTDNISVSQGNILQNFQFLASTAGNGLTDSSPGLYRFPNGLVIQWGITGTLNSGLIPLTFAGLGMIAFTSFCYAVFLQPISASPTLRNPLCINPTSVSKTGFTASVGAIYNNGAYVFAIGF